MAASCFISLAFLNVSTSSSTVFGYFVSLSTVLGLVNWVNILITYFAFLRGLRAQGIERSALPWTGILQPYGAYIALALTLIVIVFNGYKSFMPNFTVATFVTSYIGVVVYLVNIFSWKVCKGTKRIRGEEMDLVTGRRQHEEVETEKPKSFSKHLKSSLWGI